MAHWDVIVIGLGGVGSASVYHLAKGGYRVLGLDPFPPAHDRGSSHGETRIIRQAYFEHPSYVPLLHRAYELWDQLERESLKKLFFRTGLIQSGPKDGVLVPGVLDSAREHDLKVETWTAKESMKRWPGVFVQEDWLTVLENNAGFLRVEECIKSHLDLAARDGANCVHGSRVVSWGMEGSGVRVETDQGTEYADRLLIAAGSWSGELLGTLDLKLSILRKSLYWFDPDQSGYGLEDGFPCFFQETPQGFFYGFPSVDRGGVKVARHTGGESIDSPIQSSQPDPIDQAEMTRYRQHYLPGVSGRVLKQARCFYTMTPDEHFRMDQHPEHRQVTIIAGLSGHGFKFTSVLGEIASQLVTGESISLDLDRFAIQR